MASGQNTYMTGGGRHIINAILLIWTGILAVLAFFSLYRVYQKIEIVEETQDVIFSAANSEEYFNSIIEAKGSLINSN